MTAKADFNAEEWELVAAGPALAGLIVVTAQRGGALRESLAIGKAYAEAARDHSSDLIGAMASGKPTVNPREFSSSEDLRLRGVERIREAVGLLEAKATPEELDAYRAFAMSVAQRAAEADKSGGVLGIGGERVSSDERVVLEEIAAALGTEAPPVDPAS
jgi:hypothetical protein